MLRRFPLIRFLFYLLLENVLLKHKQEEINIKQRRYKYYDLIMAAFVAVLLCSNLIGIRFRL